MLEKIKHVIGMPIHATDRELGKVRDLFFDDCHWAVRYLVVETGGWLGGRKVFISPQSAEFPAGDAEAITVRLTGEQVENSPPVTEHMPVSRQKEAELAQFFGWTPYWAPVGLNVGGPYANMAEADVAVTGSEAQTEDESEQVTEPHLRSAREVSGYRLRASDGEIGHVEDYLVGDDWVIRYFIVDTRTFWPGKKVLVAPVWIEQVRWDDNELDLDMTRQQIRSGPEYDPDQRVSRQFERSMHEHHGREGYWQQ